MNTFAVFYNDKLRAMELFCLGAMAFFMPMLEGPKNIFMVFFMLLAITRQIKTGSKLKWATWDWIFLGLILSALLSALFAGIANGNEWKGFRRIFEWIFFTWLIYRSTYDKKEILFVLGLAILGTAITLAWGFDLYLGHAKKRLELHSVGHVNHSATYIAVVFGLALGAFLSYVRKASVYLSGSLLLIALFLFIGLIVGNSRAAAGVAMLLAVLLVFTSNMSLKNKMLLLAAGILTLVSIFIWRPKIVEKQEELQKQNNVLAFRSQVWNVSLEAYKFFPVFGVGNENWILIKPQDIKKAVEARHETYDPKNYYFAGYAHNVYLTALVDRGFVGLGVLLTFLFFWIKELVKTAKACRSDSAYMTVWAGSLSGCFISMGVGTMNTTLHQEFGLIAFMLLGLHLSILKNLSAQKSE